jgi:hypothetical protein
MENKLIKEVKILKFYSIVLTLAVSILIYQNLKKDEIQKFKEIDVERINIKEKNGDLKLVISNSELQHPGIICGKEMPKRERPAGLIFFNAVGDECGGLVYDGNEKEAGLVLSVDKFQDDQVMQLQYIEDTKSNNRQYGLQVWDYPIEDSYAERYENYTDLQAAETQEEKGKIIKALKEKRLLAENRLFIGKTFKKDVGLFINDSYGNPRIRIFIDEHNVAKFELLDEKGNILDQNEVIK